MLVWMGVIGDDQRLPMMYNMTGTIVAVSYTHLDVYKRQVKLRRPKPRALWSPTALKNAVLEAKSGAIGPMRR